MSNDEWLRRGIDALQRVAVSPPVAYLCPLCFSLVTPAQFAADNTIISVEHVPPGSIGGKPICLTCKPCNNWAGTYLDSQWHKIERERLYAEGKLNAPVGGKLYVSGIELNVDAVNQAGRMTFEIPRRRNNPANLQQLRQLADQGQGAVPFAQFALDQTYNRRRAEVAALRAAYLAAFAFFGYNYIIDPALNIVRQQIAEPDTEIIKHFTMPARSTSESENMIGIVAGPVEYRCVVVKFGDSAVLLPPVGVPDSPHTKLASEIQAGASGVGLTVRELDWPAGPEHRVDFQRRS